MNLFNSQMPFAQNTQPNIKYARSGEPIPVNGIDSVNAFPTLPNTISIFFHESEPIFYKKATDANNYPVVKIYKYAEMEDTPNSSRYVTVDDLKRLKEEIIDEWKHIWDDPAATNSGSTTNAAHAADFEHIEPKPNSTTDATDTSKSKSSIW